MAILFDDAFGGYSAPASSGAAPFTATDNTPQAIYLDFEGTPSTGDKIEYTMTFPAGDVTFVAEWTSSTTLVLKRVSTIPGTSNGTATLQTFTGTSANKPRTDGDLVRLRITVNRGAADGSTTITFGWHARNRQPSGSDATTNSFNVDGELTPTAATWAITGSSFRHRPNLDGRAPDTVGGGTYSWQQSLGSFAQAGAMTVERYDINGVVADGEVEGVRASQGPPVDVMYGIVGGISEGSMTVRAIGSCAAGQFPVLNLGAKWDAASATGLICGIFLPDFVVLGSYTNGVYDGDYDSIGVAALDDDTPHEYEFVIDDVAHTAQLYIDGVGAFPAPVDISFGAGSLIGPGAAGFGLWRSDVNVAGFTLVGGFQLETEAAVANNPCGNLISQHDFFDPATSDIDTRQTDSFQGIGFWRKNAASGAAIGQQGSEGFVLGSGRAVYLDTDIVGQIDGVEVPLGPDYCVDTLMVFPKRDVLVAEGGSRRLIWEDNLETLGAGEPLDGRSHAGGIAGTGVYNRRLAGDEDTDGPEAVGDGEGRAMQPADPSSPRLSYNFAKYIIDGLTLPTEYDVEVDVYNSSQAYGRFGVTVRHVEDGSWAGLGYNWDVFQHQSVGPYRNSYHANVGSQVVGALTTTSVIGGPGATREFDTRIRNPGMASVFFGGDPEILDGVLEIQFFNGQFNPEQPELNGSGAVGVHWEEDGAGAENPLRLEAIRIFDYTSTVVTPAGEYAEGEILVRYDALTDTGYGARIVFDHTDYDHPSVTAYLFERSAGVETRLSPIVDITGFPEFVHGTEPGPGQDPNDFLTPYWPRLSVQGTVLVLSFVGGSQVAVFDYASDNADETDAPVAAHDTGDPGIGGTDNSTTGSWMRFRIFSVYSPGGTTDGPCGPFDVGCVPIDPPCEAPPGSCNPHPDPPPVESEPPVYWVRGDLRWHAIPLPTAEAPNDFTAAWANLARRSLIAVAETPPKSLAARANLAWRYPFGTTDTEKPPWSNCPTPPNFDPCLEIPPLPPPPETELGAPPDRLMFAYELPETEIGSLFTAMVNAAGAWTKTDIAIAVANDGWVVANQGGYAKFQSGGVYQPSIHKQWILSVAPYVLAAQATGRLYGIQLFDDWEVPRLWPPSGVSVAVLQDVCTYARSVLPGVRLGLRARAQQFSPSNYPGNVDFIISQYRYWGLNNQSPAQYQETEIGLAATFGWDILWSVNLQHGGAIIGGERQPMSVAQAFAALTVFAGDGTNNHGVGCWKWEPYGAGGSWFAQAGAIDMWASTRNLLATLGPP